MKRVFSFGSNHIADVIFNLKILMHFELLEIVRTLLSAPHMSSALNLPRFGVLKP